MKPHPKIGEQRQRRQPFKIDKLPQALRDEIVRLREEEGRTWQQMEAQSPGLAQWKIVAPHIAALFPGRRLPRTTLQRWYDVRVEQVPSPQKQALVIAEFVAESLLPRIKVVIREELKRRNL